MNVLLREAQLSDLPFLQEMLYEAVFWRATADKPSLEEGLAYPEVSKSLADWGERDGDTAVVATVNSIPAGAAWYRYWTDEDFIRGYVDAATPVLVIAVQSSNRRQGIGAKMIAWLIARASKQGLRRISLSVSKDNHALSLYRRQGFLEYADIGDSYLMVRRIQT